MHVMLTKSNASREGVSETMEKFMINLYNEEKFHSSFIEIFENLQRCNSGIEAEICASQIFSFTAVV